MKHISKAVAGSHYSEAVRTPLAPEPEAKNPVRSAGILTLARLTAWMAVPCLILFLSACSASKHIQSIPVETIKEITRSDTLYINNVQYDSIYILKELDKDYRRDLHKPLTINSQPLVDTILIRQHDIEYRYKLLRDTIERIKLEVRHDSIPYEVRITEIKDVKFIPPWCKWLSATGGIALLLLVITLYQKLKSIV